MLHTLLLILKIMGIILTVLLGMLILVLIIPCTYKVKGNFNNNDSRLKAGVVGFLGLVYFRLTYTVDTLDYVFRVFGIPLLKGDLFEEEEDQEENPYDTDEVFEELVQDFEGNISIQDVSEETPKKTRKQKNRTKKVEYDMPDDYIVVENEDYVQPEKGNKIVSYISSFFKKIKNFFIGIKDFTKKIKRMIKLIRSKSFKIAYEYTKTIIIKILKHIKPKKLKANVTFGCEGPDTTGKILGGLAMLISLLKINMKNIKVIPDFENKRIEGDLYMKGNFVLAYLIVQVLKFYFKKEIQYIINNFKGKQA